jgi:hypothetical protein
MAPMGFGFFTDELGLLLEAKSRKKFKNALKKDDLGQLLVAEHWFERTHPGYAHIAASVLPRAFATRFAETGDVVALTSAQLNALCADARAFFEELCSSSAQEAELVLRCEKQLGASSLNPQALIERYLSQFQRVDE